MNLKYYLTEYRDISLKVLEAIEVEDIDKLIEERANILEEVKKENFPKDEFKTVMSELDIIELDKQIGFRLQNEKIKIKEELAKIQRLKNASNSYGNNKNTRSLFSAKI